jgi:photosystem II stability/assembly factor-like uncharacterized protein
MKWTRLLVLGKGIKEIDILFFLLLFLTFCSGWVIVVFPVLAQEKLANLLVNLHGVSFPTQEEGWVVGRLGKIFHTTDAGKSWEEQESGTNMLLTAVEFVDRTHGWAAGERGTILHSADGGVTWQRQRTDIPYPLFDVMFIDRERGWVVGSWGTVLYTEDGGKQWVERSLSVDLDKRGVVEPAALHDVIDPRNGEVIAKAGQLLAKERISEISRRGISDVRIRDDVTLNAVFFLNKEHGWIAGEHGLVLRTENGGKSWERSVLPRPPMQGEEDRQLGIGEALSAEELEAFGVLTPPPSLYGIFFISPFQGWVVGQEGTIARTQDGGRQWEFQPSNTLNTFYDVGIVGSSGWIVGDKGSVLVSRDGGERWEKKDLDLKYRLFWLRRLAVIPGDHAISVGANGLVLVSRQSMEQNSMSRNGEKAALKEGDPNARVDEN